MRTKEVLFPLEVERIDTSGADNDMNVRCDMVNQPYFFMPTAEYQIPVNDALNIYR